MAIQLCHVFRANCQPTGGKTDQQALVANMRVNKDRLQEVFDSVASVRVASDPAFLQVSWSRLAIQNQSLVSDASRLSQLLRQQIEQLLNTRAILIYVTVCSFGVLLLTGYVLTYRRTLKSLATLQEGTAVIGAGNLDFVIREIHKDEIGELSHAFNRMTTDLRKMYEEQKTYMRMLEQSNRDLEEFAHVASHDLQEPLRKIQTLGRGQNAGSRPGSSQILRHYLKAGSFHPFQPQ
jgi:nitrate/nitrite-specific signal transduction histidine kinase